MLSLFEVLIGWAQPVTPHFTPTCHSTLGCTWTTLTPPQNDRKANQGLELLTRHRKSCPLLFRRPHWPCEHEQVPGDVSQPLPNICRHGQTRHCLHTLLPPTNRASWQDSCRAQNCKVSCRKPASISWWGQKRGSIFYTHRSRRSLSSGSVVKFHKQLHDHCKCLSS